MTRVKLLPEEELEKIRDEYNRLIIAEEEQLRMYSEAPRVARPIIAKRLAYIAHKTHQAQMILDKNKNSSLGWKKKSRPIK